ncbi:hypothetical protein HII31_12730 [Pseudocercospora fuligena]|uniref:C2H2-type domain-containing protein n=1 Tax=Pseudocercospora fuligena TaxID=685502 RepID=A0A8H6R8P6_9PEZI|nr:hypothetical protein HII31_12730 [Pseudocercospora fuligena]
MDDRRGRERRSAWTSNEASGSARQHNGHVYNIYAYDQAKADIERAERITYSLSYEGIDNRRVAIPDAARNTFEWVVQPQSDFTTWLRMPGNLDRPDLFWITGKPGSGKSTLMKFISNDLATITALAHWTESTSEVPGKRCCPGCLGRGKTVWVALKNHCPQCGDKIDDNMTIAAHFFWHPGKPMQKSQEGMLRSLLMQLCSSNLEMVRLVCHERWHGPDRLLERPWTMKELWACLKRWGTVPGLRHCIFVDGLDEYHPHSQHKQLTSDILELATLPNFKLCVSSRPWEAFQRSLGKIHQPLRVEDLTRQDMYNYAKHHLESAALDSSDRRTMEAAVFHSLAKTLSEKAQGVFLWLHLVVESLMERLDAGCTLSELDACIDQCPSELEDYFREMIFDRINKTWTTAAGIREGTETCRVLAFATDIARRNATVACPDDWMKDVLTYWIVLETNAALDKRSAVGFSVWDISEKELEELHKTLARKISACSGGLLTTNAGDGCINKVDFTHRTAFDFLQTEEMQSALRHPRNLPAYFCDEAFPNRLALVRSKLVVKASGIESANEVIYFVLEASRSMAISSSVLNEACTVAMHYLDFWDTSNLRHLSRQTSRLREVFWTRVQDMSIAFPQDMMLAYMCHAVKNDATVLADFGQTARISNARWRKRHYRLTAQILACYCAHGLDVRTLVSEWLTGLEHLRKHRRDGAVHQDYWELSKVMIRNGAFSSSLFLQKDGPKLLVKSVSSKQRSEMKALCIKYSDQRVLNRLHNTRRRYRREKWATVYAGEDCNTPVKPVWSDHHESEVWVNRASLGRKLPHTIPDSIIPIPFTERPLSAKELDIWILRHDSDHRPSKTMSSHALQNRDIDDSTISHRRSHSPNVRHPNFGWVWSRFKLP